MVRILHIVASMNQGGIENFLMNVYRNIDKKKIQFDFCMAKKEIGFFDHEIEQLGGKIFKLDNITKIGIKKFRKQFERVLEENTYDVVHCHMNVRCLIFLPIAKKKKVSIRIAHSHISSVTMRTWKGVINNAMAYYVRMTHNRYANVLIACSKDAAKWLYGRNERRVTIIKNGIETNKFIYNEKKRSKLRAELGIDLSETLIGHVGRFTPQKNHYFLIEIFREYHIINEKSKLLLIGSGELQEAVHQKVKEYSLENAVIFAGNLGNVYDYMSAMDLFLFPSLYEGLPVVLVEAQCSGLKCIISDTISSEVDVTDLITRCSIHSESMLWVEQILETKKCKREHCDKWLKETGFDIQSTVNALEKIYIGKEQQQ